MIVKNDTHCVKYLGAYNWLIANQMKPIVLIVTSVEVLMKFLIGRIALIVLNILSIEII